MGFRENERYEIRGRVAETIEELDRVDASIKDAAERINRLIETKTWQEDLNSGCWLKERGREIEALQTKKKDLREKLDSLKEEYRDLTGKQI
jgi:chromosome segregation ATPase